MHLHTRRRLQPCIETSHFVPGTIDPMMVQSKVLIRYFVLVAPHIEHHSLTPARRKMVVVLEQLVVFSMPVHQTQSLGNCYLVAVFELSREQVAFHHSKVFFLTE